MTMGPSVRVAPPTLSLSRLMQTNATNSDYLVLFRNTAWYGDLSPEEVQRLMGG